MTRPRFGPLLGCVLVLFLGGVAWYYAIVFVVALASRLLEAARAAVVAAQ